MQRLNAEKSEWVLSQINDIRVYPHGLKGRLKRIRVILKNFAKSGLFENFMTLCVTINTITLAIDRYNIPEKEKEILATFNFVFTIIFCAEMIFKLAGLGMKRYLRDKMNYLDGAIVILSLIELAFFSDGSSSLSAFRTVRIFRTFRVLRVARLLRTLHSMQIIIGVI